ncbi:hypothetical protein [Siccirubricoccus phaeus]|uniref:hypothetical protein n=1 Tax=Siccirubricoccus phaeus TaxID=2595053 RepID=UPI0011F29765|nr:hypothetical protein [Siccirubricoccus phaeus]
MTAAIRCLLYEAAGIGANLIGGWLAMRFGIARMLAVGLATQSDPRRAAGFRTPRGGARFP